MKTSLNFSNKMLCGHPEEYVMSADEGTSFCLGCYYESLIAQYINQNLYLKMELVNIRESFHHDGLNKVITEILNNVGYKDKGY